MNQRASLYIQTLAKCGSITRAADRLYITPSALSKYISTLEREAGTQLFSRIGKHFVLTYAGERYMDWCLRLDALSTQMENEMRDLSKQREGKIRIGVQSAISVFIVEQVVPKFMQEYPNICISLTESTSLPILEQLKSFQLDAAISTKPPNAEPFYQEPLYSMEQILLVPKEHPLVQRAVQKPGQRYPWVDLDWCRGERFVTMHPGQSPRLLSEKLLAPIWEDIQIVMEVHSMRTMVSAVKSRIGIIQTGAGMDRLYCDPSDELVSLSFADKHSSQSYYLFYYKDIYQSEAMKGFLDIARAQFRLLEASQ